jgi:UDP-N-acetylmuramoyl-tripeptide--D-alanyl-D-alanine ligase
MGISTIGRRILWQRTQDYLKRYQPTVVGITGSTGTALVKDALFLMLKDTQRIRAAPFSYHTRAGVALATLGVSRQRISSGWIRLLAGSRVKELAEEEPSVILLELSSVTPGDVDFFAQTLPVACAIVTNVQSANLHLYKSKDLVAHEQSSLIAALPQAAVACLNRDDPLVAAMAGVARARVIWFGESDGSDIRLVRTHRVSGGGHACEFVAHGRPLEVHLPHIVAPHQLVHVAAALAGVSALGNDIEQAAACLGKLTPPRGRLQLITGRAGSNLLDDSYDATPESMLAALEALAALPLSDTSRSQGRRGRRIAILGDIEHLGAYAVSWHSRIGEQAASSANIVIAVGENMRTAGAAALRAGAADVHHFPDSRSVGEWLGEYVREGDLILVCGSRTMRMERVVNQLLADPARHDKQPLRQES